MRVRVTKAIKVRRTLPNGSAVHIYWLGDYEVGIDMPQEVARDAIKRGQAKRIRKKGERETKSYYWPVCEECRPKVRKRYLEASRSV